METDGSDDVHTCALAVIVLLLSAGVAIRTSEMLRTYGALMNCGALSLASVTRMFTGITNPCDRGTSHKAVSATHQTAPLCSGQMFIWHERVEFERMK
jgi:hypothetical protein